MKYSDIQSAGNVIRKRKIDTFDFSPFYLLMRYNGAYTEFNEIFVPKFTRSR